MARPGTTLPVMCSANAGAASTKERLGPGLVVVASLSWSALTRTESRIVCVGLTGGVGRRIYGHRQLCVGHLVASFAWPACAWTESRRFCGGLTKDLGAGSPGPVVAFLLRPAGARMRARAGERGRRGTCVHLTGPTPSLSTPLVVELSETEMYLLLSWFVSSIAL